MRIASTPGVHLLIQEGSIRLYLHPYFFCEIESDDPQFISAAYSWLEQYAKRAPPPLPALFQLESLSPFQQVVLRNMQNFPFGETKSYQELGRLAGYPNASRAIGGACKRNPFPLFFPCHRVIQKDGNQGGFAYNPRIKERLLKFEKTPLIITAGELRSAQ